MTENKESISKHFFEWAKENSKLATFLIALLILSLVGLAIYVTKILVENNYQLENSNIKIKPTEKDTFVNKQKIQGEIKSHVYPNKPSQSPVAKQKNTLKMGDSIIESNIPSNNNIGGKQIIAQGQGNIAAENVTINNAAPRRILGDFQKNQLIIEISKKFPNGDLKKIKISVLSIAGDEEATSFSIEIANYLKSTGYQANYIGAFIQPGMDKGIYLKDKQTNNTLSIYVSHS